MVQRLNHMNQVICTASDSPKFREDLKNQRESAKNLIKQIATALDAPPSEPEKPEHQRIVQKFGNVVSQCKQTIQAGIQKESAFPAKDAISTNYGSESM